MVKVGDLAPEIVLEDGSGNTLHLSTYRGQKVVLYFYPKDMTPGCTVEACDFRDLHPRLQKADVKVIGVSPDPVSRHASFADKYSLPFSLLADVDRVAAEAYGVWQEKSYMGKKFMGIVRTTFLIGEDGKVKAVWRKVRVKDHAAEVASKALGESVRLPKAATKKETATKKTAKKTAKKAATKKAATKKAATKKAATKKTATKKAATKKAATKKTATKKTATKKAATKKAATKKAATKKAATKKKR